MKTNDFLPNTFPEVVVLLAKLPVEPVVDDWVAEVVGEDEVHPVVAPMKDEDRTQGCVRDEEADGDGERHLDDENVFRAVRIPATTARRSVTNYVWYGFYMCYDALQIVTAYRTNGLTYVWFPVVWFGATWDFIFLFILKSFQQMAA